MIEGLLGGVKNFLMPDEQQMAQIDPRYGVARGDVRDAALNTLGNMSALLLAAGQPIEPAQRAQYLSQLGGAGAGFGTDIYNASQRRLMQAQMQEKQTEMGELNQLREAQKTNPQGLATSLGVPVEYITRMSPTDLRAVMKQRATEDPQVRALRGVQIKQGERDLATKYQVQRGEDGTIIAVNPQDPTDFKIIQKGFEERPLTPEERLVFKIPPEAPAVMTKGGPKILSAGGTTVNVGGNDPPDAELRKKLSGQEAQRLEKISTAADVAGGLRQDLELLDQVLTIAPQGPITGRLAQMFPGASSAGAVVQSIVKRVAPSLRIEGSGATSDIEYEGMLQSLPALTNKTDANAMISEAMKQKAQINMERGAIVMAYQNREIEENEMRRRLSEINRRSILSPALKQMIGDMGGGRAGGAIPAGNGTLTPNANGSYTWTPGGQ